ncbi:MAG: hypothetical protein ACD_62C00541G0002 [uncultured bacterium]|nr:MAG: hypothetical protein ACD_62C00541G0002 [uncultured bacterium]
MTRQLQHLWRKINNLNFGEGKLFLHREGKIPRPRAQIKHPQGLVGGTVNQGHRFPAPAHITPQTQHVIEQIVGGAD